MAGDGVAAGSCEPVVASVDCGASGCGSMVDTLNGSPFYRLAVRVVAAEHGRHLPALLAEWNAAGLSLRAIVAELTRRYGIEVTHQTVATWLRYPDS